MYTGLEQLKGEYLNIFGWNIMKKLKRETSLRYPVGTVMISLLFCLDIFHPDVSQR